MYFSEKQTPGTELKIKIKKVLYNKKSRYQKIKVFESEDWGKVLTLDDLFMVTEKDEFFYHESLVHPLLCSLDKIDRVLIIGGGDGGTLREILKHPVKEVYQVEIDEEVIEVCKRYFPWAKRVYSDSRVKLIIQDAYDYVKNSEDKFNAIFLDTSDPVGPAKVFYRKRFFINIRNLVFSDGGISMQAESPVHHINTIKKLYKILKETFPLVKPYFSPMPSYPGGYWMYFILSLEKNFSFKLKRIPFNTKFYNSEIHRALFSVPEFMKAILK